MLIESPQGKTVAKIGEFGLMLMKQLQNQILYQGLLRKIYTNCINVESFIQMLLLAQYYFFTHFFRFILSEKSVNNLRS